VRLLAGWYVCDSFLGIDLSQVGCAVLWAVREPGSWACKLSHGCFCNRMPFGSAVLSCACLFEWLMCNIDLVQLSGAFWICVIIGMLVRVLTDSRWPAM
jgi:hypothetical protein